MIVPRTQIKRSRCYLIGFIGMRRQYVETLPFIDAKMDLGRKNKYSVGQVVLAEPDNLDYSAPARILRILPLRNGDQIIITYQLNFYHPSGASIMSENKIRPFDKENQIDKAIEILEYPEQLRENMERALLAARSDEAKRLYKIQHVQPQKSKTSSPLRLANLKVKNSTKQLIDFYIDYSTLLDRYHSHPENIKEIVFAKAVEDVLLRLWNRFDQMDHEKGPIRNDAFTLDILKLVFDERKMSFQCFAKSHIIKYTISFLKAFEEALRTEDVSWCWREYRYMKGWLQVWKAGYRVTMKGRNYNAIVVKAHQRNLKYLSQFKWS